MGEKQGIILREQIELRSEEVQELLGRIPPWIIRWGITVIFLTIVEVFVGSWFFQYPDMIESSLVVTTMHPPASIVARTSGKIDVLFVKDHQQVKQGDVLACIENTAFYDDVVFLKTALELLRESIFSENTFLVAEFPEDSTLGALQASYANFLTRYEDYQHFVNLRYHQKKITSLEKQIQHYHALHERSARQKDLLQQELALSQRQYDRYQHLKDQALVSQKALETLQSTVLQKTYALEEAEADLGNIIIQIARLEESKLDLTHQHEERKKELQLRGAGKVKVGQAVHIKFANYPSREYGVVTGIVERISLVPSDNFYVVEVSFPEGLTTNYGNSLPFTQEMQGTAEIITEDRRLVERFFNLSRHCLNNISNRHYWKEDISRQTGSPSGVSNLNNYDEYNHGELGILDRA